GPCSRDLLAGWIHFLRQCRRADRTTSARLTFSSGTNHAAGGALSEPGLRRGADTAGVGYLVVGRLPALVAVRSLGGMGWNRLHISNPSLDVSAHGCADGCRELGHPRWQNVSQRSSVVLVDQHGPVGLRRS